MPRAVLAASIFHYGEHSIGEAKRFMAAAGLPDAPRSAICVQRGSRHLPAKRADAFLFLGITATRLFPLRLAAVYEPRHEPKRRARVASPPIIKARRTARPEDSHTRRLLDGAPIKPAKKLGEEAVEVAIAALAQDDDGADRRDRRSALPSAGGARVPPRRPRRRAGRAGAPHGRHAISRKSGKPRRADGAALYVHESASDRRVLALHRL